MLALSCWYFRLLRQGQIPLPFKVSLNEGRLYDTAGNPLAESVNFRVQILNSASDCILYEETQTFNLSSTSGRFALEVGSATGAGKRTGDDPGFAMWQVFKNTGSLAVPAGVCPGTPFNPALGEKRKLRVFIDPASGPEEKLSPDQNITSAPSSLMSQSLQGIGADGFVQITGNITQSNLDDLSSEHTDLMDLAAGTSSLYMAAGSSVTTDDVFASDQMAVGTTTPAAGVELEIQDNDPTLRLEATDGGAGNMAIQFFDTAGTDQAQIMSTEGTAGLTFSTDGASALVLDGSQNAQFQASVTVAGTIQGGVYDNAQEAGTLLPALTTCGAGCAGTQWMNSDLSLLRYWDGVAVRSVGSFSGAETAGQVLTSNGPGNAPTFQAIDDTTKLSLDGSDTMAGDLNMGGNEITNLGAPVNPGDAVNKTYADSNLVGETLAAPTAGEDLQAIRWNNTAGNWEYFSPTAGTVSAVSAAAPLASSGGATPDISLNFNDGLRNNGGNLEVNLSSDLTFSTGQVAIATDGVTSTHILDDTIDNIDINANADIARTKLADGTANMVLVNDGTGSMSESATIDATELGFLNNVSSNIQTQLDGKEASLGFTPVNKAGDTMTGALGVNAAITITGSADSVQLSAQANAAQTANLFELKNSAGTPIFTVQADGTISAATDIASKNYVDTEIAGITDNDTTYTADGLGIEVASEEFSLELNGNTLSKSVTGLKVEEGNLTLSNIGGYDANENIDHTGVTLTAGTGLTGGGDISADRIFNVVGGDGITANADDIAVDLDTDPGLEFNTGALRVKTGAGLGRDSTGVFHADTSSVADSDNANGVILQDITFDTFGHVQTVGTTDLDSRYYTETESDSNFVDASGDSMSGNLTMSTQAEIRLSDDDNTDYISLKAPTGTTQYDLTLPNAVGNANDVLQTDASGNLSWVAIPSAPVTDVFGRTGNVTAQSGDYNAGLITSSATGDVTSTNVQAAITELDTEKVATTRNVNTPAAGGLTGGGDLSSDRTLSIDITGMTATSTQNAGDEILIFSGADTAMRKMSRSDFIAGIDTDTDTTYSADGEGIELSGTTFGLELDGTTLQKGASGLSINQANLDHGSIGGLTDDDHTQYANLTGRSGGQSLIGGTSASDNLTLESTSDTTKGNLVLQPNGGNVGVGISNPSTLFQVNGAARVNSLSIGTAFSTEALEVNGNISLRGGDRSVSTPGANTITLGDGNDVIQVKSATFAAGPGNVGIGTTSPDTLLHVEGGIKIGTMAAGDCDAVGEAGRIRYNSGDLDYCDGSSWQTLGTAAGGEINTAANVGTGTGLFRDKTGSTINLKSINAEAGGEISITNNANDITLDVIEGNLDITSIGGYDANENIDHTGVTLTAGTGLTGGGDISANRTFNVVGGDGITANADDIAVNLDTDPGLEFNTGAIRVKTGAGLGRDSTGVFHTDTSSVADSDNANGVILQDITFDTFGHVQTVGTTDLDSRYYTETESDSNFVDNSGDTMTGALGVNAAVTVTGSADAVQLSAQAQAAQTANLFELKNSAGTPIFTVQADGTISAATDIVDKDYVDTAIGGLTDNDTLYTADGEGIALASEEFSLELDGTTLSKSATGLKVNAIGSAEITNGAIVDADINASAAIARSKVATGTVNRVLVNDGSGNLSESATIDSTELGHLNGVSSNIQTQLDGKQASLGFTPVDVAGDTMTGALDMGAGAAQLSTTDSEATPAFTFQDDTNTGLFSPAADEIAISTAGSEVLRVDGSGNVGIGTASPVGELHINAGSGGTADIQLTTADTGTTINDGLTIGADNGSSWIWGNENTPLIFATNGSERARIEPSGAMIVGATTPQSSALFEIASTTKGFLPPRMTTAERDAVGSPAEGLTVFNTTTDKLNIYAGGAWTEAGGGSFGSGNSGFVGSLFYPGTAACDSWERGSDSFTNIDIVDNGCNSPTLQGAALAPDEGKIPAVKFASIPAGRYQLVVNAHFSSATAGTCHFRIHDGSGGRGVLQLNNSDGRKANLLIGDFNYSSAQTNITYYIQSEDEGSGSTCKIVANHGNDDVRMTLIRIDGNGKAIELADDDGNTKVQVEKNADENIIRFDTAGSERMTIDAAGDVNMAGGLTANSFTGDGSALTNIGATAIADGSITLADTNFGSTNGINIPQLAADPGSPTAGQMYYNTSTNKMMVYNGSSWVEAGSGSGGGPSFSVHRNGSDQTVTAGVSTKINWTTEVFDTGSSFDLASDRFQPTVAGKYFIAGSAYCSSVSTSRCAVAILKNGIGLYSGSEFLSTGRQISKTSGVVDLNGTTDYVELFVYIDGATTLNGSTTLTHFMGSFLGGSSGGTAINLADTDNDTIIHTEESSDEDIIRFDTAGSERMVINASGSVGIGTTSPNAKLTVEGVMTLDHQASDPIGTAGYGSLYTKTDGSLYYRDGTGTVTDLLAGGGSGDFMADGSVPMTGQLQSVGGSAALPGVTFDGDEDTGFYHGAPGAIGFSSNGTPSAILNSTQLRGTYSAGFMLKLDSPNASSPAYSFFGDTDTGLHNPAPNSIAVSTNGTEKLRIDTNGNVGIGTTAPSAKFQVQGGSGQIQALITGAFTSSGAGSLAAGLTISTDLTGANGDTTGLDLINAGSNVGASIATQGNTETITNVTTMTLSEPGITVNGGDTVTNASTLRISGAPTEGTNNYALLVNSGTTSFGGNVGVGTTSPDYNLQAVGNLRVGHDDGGSSGADFQIYKNGADPYLTVDKGTVGGMGMGYRDTGFTFGTFGGGTGSEDIDFRTGITWNAHPGTTGTSRLFVDASAGEIGMGTTSPAGALDVTSTTGAFVPPRMTEVQRDALSSPPNGAVVYNSTDERLNIRANGDWVSAGGRTSCPTGFTLIGTAGTLEAFCISTNSESDDNWINAATTCYNKSPKARLCSTDEWVMACIDGTPSGMTGNWEWVAEVDGGGDAMRMGNSSCADNDFQANTNTSTGSRCCFR